MATKTTKPVRIPLEISDTITAIIEIWRSQPMAQPEIKRRLELLTNKQHYADPTGADTLAILQDIKEQLTRIEDAAKAAAAKGTRPTKPRTTRKTDKS